jgi:hypothetical protein
MDSFFEVFDACAQDFFHPPELGAPQIAHVVEALVDGVKVLVNGFELRVRCNLFLHRGEAHSSTFAARRLRRAARSI